MTRILLLLLAVSHIGLALDAKHAQTVVSVLSPLAYGPTCWSSVQLQNLGTARATVNVEGHKGSGALVALVGATSVNLTLEPGQKVTLRLDVPDEESPEGWVRIRESVAEATEPTVAVSGQTECHDDNHVTTVAQTVAFPTQDPWLAAAVDDLPGRLLMILNASNRAATATACYSTGSTVTLPGTDGGVVEATPLCAEKRLLQIPPFGTTTLPIVSGGNSRFGITTNGASLVLRVLVPQHGGTKTYEVDSSVKFGEPVADHR